MRPVSVDLEAPDDSALLQSLRLSCSFFPALPSEREA